MKTIGYHRDVKMTTDRNSLLKLIKEYGDSLLRIESEKDLQKAIAEQAEEECQVKPAQFKKAAMALSVKILAGFGSGRTSCGM